MKRLFDILSSVFALIVLSPVLLVAALGIKLTSKGTVFFKAHRAGVNGKSYRMFKFRTMHTVQPKNASKITGARDPRIFAFGRLLRATKIDELPQLINVVTGEMSIVGPRPEDVSIVSEHYTPWMMETLEVRPGMASPGSLYGSMYDYKRDSEGIKVDDPETDYIKNLLPMKLAIELVYVRRQSFWYDIRVVVRTVWMIVRVVFGKKEFPDPPEYTEAQQILRGETEHPSP